MIFSKISAGLDQLIGRKTKNPLLNQEVNKCFRSIPTGASSGLSLISASRSFRIPTKRSVAPSGWFNLLMSSCRFGSLAVENAL